MSLLFLSDVPLDNPQSGAEQVLYRQAVGLSQNNKAVAAISRSNGPKTRIIHRYIEGVHEACYGSNPDFFLKFIFDIFRIPSKLLDQIQSTDPISAVICHQPFTCFPLILKNRLKITPVFYIFHSPSHEEYLLSKDGKIGKFSLFLAYMRRLLERYCLQHAQKIIVLSDYMKKKVIEVHKIPENRIEVNWGGVDLTTFKFAVNRAQLKGELNLSDGDIHLLTIRNLEPRMGLDNLVKAMSFLIRKNHHFHLTIGGEGNEERKIKKLINELGLGKNITMSGFIPSNLMPKYYGAADFFIIPTEHLEGFGLVTVESLACGTPVLGTPIGGTLEILSDLNQDFLFRDTSPESIAEGIEKTIEKYFANKRAYEEVRLQCHRYAKKNYSWERHIQQLQSTILTYTAEHTT